RPSARMFSASVPLRPRMRLKSMPVAEEGAAWRPWDCCRTMIHLPWLGRGGVPRHGTGTLRRRERGWEVLPGTPAGPDCGPILCPPRAAGNTTDVESGVPADGGRGEGGGPHGAVPRDGRVRCAASAGAGLAVVFRVAAEAALLRIGWPPRPAPAGIVAIPRLLVGVAGRVGGFLAAWHDGHRPSSNTTWRVAPTVVSPGATGGAAPAASIAIAFIIGTGCGAKPPPSPMLTMRRTRRPRARAYSSARACAFFNAAWRASSYTASGSSISKFGPWTWLAPLATSASSTSPSRATSRTLTLTVLLAW